MCVSHYCDKLLTSEERVYLGSQFVLSSGRRTHGRRNTAHLVAWCPHPASRKLWILVCGSFSPSSVGPRPWHIELWHKTLLFFRKANVSKATATIAASGPGVRKLSQSADKLQTNTGSWKPNGNRCRYTRTYTRTITSWSKGKFYYFEIHVTDNFKSFLRITHTRPPLQLETPTH